MTHHHSPILDRVRRGLYALRRARLAVADAIVLHIFALGVAVAELRRARRQAAASSAPVAHGDRKTPCGAGHDEEG